jgi:hypothetical protein
MFAAEGTPSRARPPLPPDVSVCLDGIVDDLNSSLTSAMRGDGLSARLKHGLRTGNREPSKGAVKRTPHTQFYLVRRVCYSPGGPHCPTVPVMAAVIFMWACCWGTGWCALPPGKLGAATRSYKTETLQGKVAVCTHTPLSFPFLSALPAAHMIV